MHLSPQVLFLHWTSTPLCENPDVLTSEVGGNYQYNLVYLDAHWGWDGRSQKKTWRSDSEDRVGKGFVATTWSV